MFSYSILMLLPDIIWFFNLKTNKEKLCGGDNLDYKNLEISNKIEKKYQ